MAKKVSVEEMKSYDFWVTLLKAGTYAVVGTAGTAVMMAIQDGIDLPQALLMGLGVGLIAGVKNVLKAGWDVDLDLARLKK